MLIEDRNKISGSSKKSKNLKIPDYLWRLFWKNIQVVCYDFFDYFLLFLLALLLGQPCFYFSSCFEIIDFAIGGIESKGKDIAIDVSGYSL